MKRQRRDPERLDFFVDRDLGRGFYEVLAADPRFNTYRHDDHFDQDTEDPDWIVPTADCGWIGVTHDKAITRNHWNVIKRADARLLIAVGKDFQAMAKNFLATYARIERFVRKRKAPFAGRIYLPTPKDLKRGNPKNIQGSIREWEIP